MTDVAVDIDHCCCCCIDCGSGCCYGIVVATACAALGVAVVLFGSQSGCLIQRDFILVNGGQKETCARRMGATKYAWSRVVGQKRFDQCRLNNNYNNNNKDDDTQQQRRHSLCFPHVLSFTQGSNQLAAVKATGAATAVRQTASSSATAVRQTVQALSPSKQRNPNIMEVDE